MAKFMCKLRRLVALTLLVTLMTFNSASAISADLAKKCRAMAVKAHPSPKPGTKSNGADRAQRELFSACIKNGTEKKD